MRILSCSNAIPKEVHRPVVSASPGNLLGIQFLRPHNRPPNPKHWASGPSVCVLTSSLVDSDASSSVKRMVLEDIL